MKEGVVILGAGIEVIEIIKALEDCSIPVLAYGYDPDHINSANACIEFCIKKKIQIIEGHTKLGQFNPQFIIMISYPPLISQNYIEKYKFINIHGALLPKYRGMHGGTWALINGEREHGFSVHLVDHGIDSGPIYFQFRVTATISDNIMTIREKIFLEFKKNIKSIVTSLYFDKLVPVPQDEREAIYVSRRKQEDGLVNWNDTSWDIHNLVRALVPPYTKGAFTSYKGENLYILKTVFVEMNSYKGIPGQIVANFKGKGVLVKTKDTAIIVQEVEYANSFYKADDFFKTVGARLG